MFIKQISIDNIRSHKQTTLDLERISLIKGANGSGKSTVEQSIDLALTRRCSITGAGGQGQTDLIRFGQDKGLIELAIDLDGIPVDLRASLTMRSGLNVTLSNPEDKKWNPVDFARELADDKDVLSCLCNNRYFVDRPPAEQKSLIASIILPAHTEWPEDIKNALHTVSGDNRYFAKFDWQAGTFEFIEAAHKACFDTRTDTNRDIKNWRAPEPGAKYVGPPVDEVRVILAERQNERTAAAVEKQKLAGDIAQAEQAKANHVRRANDAAARIETEKRERERIAEAQLSKAAAKKLETEAAGLKRAEELEKTTLTRASVINQLEEQIQKLDKLAKYSECPSCKQIITDEVFASIVDPITKNLNDAHEAQMKDYDERKALGDPAGAQKKLDAHNTVEADLARIDKRIKDLERTVKTATEEAEAIKPEELPRPTGLDEKIADLDARIQKGTGYLEAASRADALKVDAEKAMQRKKELDEELARLEKLITYFGPKGVKADLIAQHIGTFQASINSTLERWGYACELSIEPWSFTVRRDASPFAAQLHQLNQSKKYNFSVAFSVALAMSTGWRFVVLDGADLLDASGRNTLMGALLESELDQALVLVTDESTAQPPAIDGTTFIKLTEHPENGIDTTTAEVLACTPMEPSHASV